MAAEAPKEEYRPKNFLEEIIERDLAEGKNNGRVHTRFPPEPNGYLHIGHAKAICTSFGLAEQYGGLTNLRFDDTNPVTEDTEYVNSIKRDIKWLGFDWGDREYYTSDYFETLYGYAVQLIEQGNAYVDASTAEEMAAAKGHPGKPATPSPYRDTDIATNLDLFKRMREGEFEEGAYVLRAKIDLASNNMLLRDPVIYRIKYAHHHRTGDAWCIYPMYDFAHGQSDSIEKITHSLCSLEFDVHRPMYDWFIEKLGIFPSKQYEFARLNLNYTIMSKRKLLQLVENNHVSGWDDPRMPTISGLRRRGYTPKSIRDFIERVGTSKRNNVIDVSLLEFSVKQHLNAISTRVMVVQDPIKVVITNYPEGQTEQLPIINNPEDESAGSRTIPFGREIYIESTDFMEVAPNKKYFRLAVGKTVRLKGAYIIECDEVIKDDAGNIIELHCRYFADSKSGSDTSGIKVKGTIHFVSAAEAIPVEVRLYDRLFNDETPDGHADKHFLDFLNPDSLKVIPQAYAEPSLAAAKEGEYFQFLRSGYYCVDPDSSSDKLVFNRTVTLRDGWAKAQGKKK